jgi:CysZ protein
VLDAAVAAAAQILTPPFRNALFKTLALTLALLALVWVGLEKLIAAALHAHWLTSHPWLVTALSLIGGTGLFIGLVFLVTPVSFLVAGFFFDDLAQHVELDIDPKGAGRAMPLGDAAFVAAQFAAVALVVNLVALLLLFAPGLNAVAFFGANAYLFGRGYFELAALRHLPRAEVARLRRSNEGQLFMAGLVMAAMLAIPFVNLLTPLFGAAFMVRIAGSIMRKRAAPAVAARPPA